MKSKGCFKPHFLYLRSKCSPLKEAYHLTNFGKVYKRSCNVLAGMDQKRMTSDGLSASIANFAIYLWGYSEEVSKFKMHSGACVKNRLHPMSHSCVPKTRLIQQTPNFGYS